MKQIFFNVSCKTTLNIKKTRQGNQACGDLDLYYSEKKKITHITRKYRYFFDTNSHWHNQMCKV